MIRPKLGDRWLRRWVLAVVCGGVACAVVACQSTSPSEGTRDSGAASEESLESGASAAPSAGEMSEVGIAPSSAEGGAPRTLPLLPSTRRTSEGLPSSLAGYQSWYRLDPAVSPRSRGPHLEISRTYVLLPRIHTVGVGDSLEPPLPDGAVLVLESKSPGTDFIQAISMMRKADGAWEYQDFARPDSDSAFGAKEGQADACVGCHLKAPADSVFAPLELR